MPEVLLVPEVLPGFLVELVFVAFVFVAFVFVAFV